MIEVSQPCTRGNIAGESCEWMKTVKVLVQNMQSSSATYESILPGSNSMRLAGTGLPGLPSESSSRVAPQLTSAEAKKV